MKRCVSTLSMMNPLKCGDEIELDCEQGGEAWIVKQGGYGWQLRSAHDNRLHPRIHDIQEMADFIQSILYHCHSRGGL